MRAKPKEMAYKICISIAHLMSYRKKKIYSKEPNIDLFLRLCRLSAFDSLSLSLQEAHTIAQTAYRYRSASFRRCWWFFRLSCNVKQSNNDTVINSVCKNYCLLVSSLHVLASNITDWLFNFGLANSPLDEQSV